MHHIQRKILQLLMHTSVLNYARLRPDGVEGNHFAYHLAQLIRAKLVVKQGSGYTLTPEGLTFADRANHVTIAPLLQPHIGTALHITNAEGQLILFTHAFQPYLGYIGFPQGRTHYEEHVAESAARELFEKTGLQNVAIRQVGIAYITATQDDRIISKTLVHVFTGTVQGTPQLISDNPKKGTSSWGVPKKKAGTHYMPGFWQIRKLVTESNDLFFVELEDKL